MNNTYIIAEAGVNHNGSLDLAKQLSLAALGTGADAVKFQTFSADRLASNSAQMAEYQVKNTGVTERQIDMLRRLELTAEEFKELQIYCAKIGIDFLSSPFDIESVTFLVKDLNLDLIKIPSGEITNGPYLLAISQLDKPVILSTGMSNLQEIRAALDVLAYGYLHKPFPKSFDDIKGCATAPEGISALDINVRLLHCTTEYPAPVESINLRAIKSMVLEFGLPVGYSDHSAGISIPIAAVAMGATIIEKHLTLDQTMTGPDHKASIEPALFSEMVQAIRSIETALGSGDKKPHDVELKNISIARKIIIAKKTIKNGDMFSVENLTTMRYGEGLSPMGLWDLLDKTANQEYLAGEPIQQ